MPFRSIGLLHPGEMGAGIGAVLVEAGFEVRWASDGRRPPSVRRAASAGLVDAHNVAAIKDSCDFVISVCPPSAALDVARHMSGFGGLYLDANAVAPQTARKIAAVIELGGGSYVDGGIIGAPPSGARSTRLYLSGPLAHLVRDTFAGTTVDARVISEDKEAASALKVCFAAWTKGTTALLLDIRALAIAQDVEALLLAEWQSSLPELVSRSLHAGHQAATKGWRWVGEMDEIAATFASAGLPDGFHRAAAEVYARAPRHQEAAADAETLESVLDALVRRETH